jgi:ABC-type nickel/cobalt efflux system permease component RcnA
MTKFLTQDTPLWFSLVTALLVLGLACIGLLETYWDSRETSHWADMSDEVGERQPHHDWLQRRRNQQNETVERIMNPTNERNTQ